MFNGRRQASSSFTPVGQPRGRSSIVPASSQRRTPAAPPSAGRLGVGVSPFDPTRRTTYGFASGGRVSAVYAWKDSRLLSDKNYQAYIVNKLLDYMREANFQMTFPEKMLRTGSASVFKQVFELLYKNIEPNYVCAAKAEEEVPRLFRELGYPVTISKSSLQAVTPQTWPTLLGALSWLVDLLRFANGTVATQVLFGDVDDEDDAPPFEQDSDEPRASTRQLLFSNLVKTCVLRQEGGDHDEAAVAAAVAEEDEWLRGQLISEELLRAVAAEERRNKTLDEQLAAYQGSLGDGESRADALIRLETDKAQLSDFADKMDDYIDTQKQTLEEGKRRRLDAEEQLTTKRREAAALQRAIAAQAVSAEEVRQMKRGRDEAETAVAALRKSCAGQSDEKWTLETNISRLKDQVTQWHAHLRQRAEDMQKKLSPVAGEWLTRVDLSMSAFDPKFQAYCADTLKPGVRAVYNLCSEATHAVANELLVLEGDVNKVKEMQSACGEELVELNEQVVTAKKEQAVLAERMPSDAARAKEELAELQTRLATARGSANMSSDERLKLLRQLEQTLEEVRLDTHERRVAKQQDFSECLAIVMEFVGTSQKVRIDCSQQMDNFIAAKEEHSAFLTEHNARINSTIAALKK